MNYTYITLKKHINIKTQTGSNSKRLIYETSYGKKVNVYISSD